MNESHLDRAEKTLFTYLFQVLGCRNGSFLQPLGERPHPALGLRCLPELSVHIRQPDKPRRNALNRRLQQNCQESKTGRQAEHGCKPYPFSPGYVGKWKIISVVQRRSPAGVNFDLHLCTDILHSLLDIQFFRGHLEHESMKEQMIKNHERN